MTVSSSTARVSYSGNGSTTAFAVPFYFLANSQLTVTLRLADGSESTKVLGTDYTVTGAGVLTGGTVTMTSAPASGTTLVVTRNVPLTQETDLQPNDRLPAETLEQSIDKLTMISQQIDETIDRTLKAPVSDSASLDMTIPSSADRAGKFLKFDTNGEPTAATSPESAITVEDYGAVGNGVADDTAAIQAALNALTAGDTLLFRNNYKVTASLTITSKSRIRLTGKGRVFLSGAASSAYIFKLVGTCDEIEIDGLTLVGDGNASYTQTAIGCDSGQTISNTRFHDLNISSINVGIAHNANLSGSWTKGFCYSNTFKDILGTVSGSGYGVLMAKATQVTVTENIFDNCGRHSIYQGAGVNCGNIIANNLIVNHRSTVGDGSFRAAAVIARSTDVTFTGNKFDNCYDCCLEISHVTSDSASCRNVLIEGNSFTNRGNAVHTILIGEQAVPGFNIFSGDGTTVDFTVTFPFKYSSDLIVVLESASGVQAVQTFGTDYTVSGSVITMATAPLGSPTQEKLLVSGYKTSHINIFNNTFDDDLINARRVSYAGNGSNKNFAVPFAFSSSSDLIVTKRTATDPPTTPENEVILASPADYTVSGSTVILTTAPTALQTVFIGTKLALPPNIYILNGTEIAIENNRFIRKNVTNSLSSCVLYGDNTYLSNGNQLNHVVIRNNTATADASAGTAGFVTVCSTAATGTNYYVVKDNYQSNWPKLVAWDATPTNPNSFLRLRATATYNFSTISANTGIAALIQIDGCKRTSSVSGRPQYSLISSNTLYAFYAKDDADNQVAVQVVNVSTSPIDPSDQTFVIDIDDIEPYYG